MAQHPDKHLMGPSPAEPQHQHSFCLDAIQLIATSTQLPHCKTQPTPLHTFTHLYTPSYTFTVFKYTNMSHMVLLHRAINDLIFHTDTESKPNPDSQQIKWFWLSF